MSLLSLRNDSSITSRRAHTVKRHRRETTRRRRFLVGSLIDRLEDRTLLSGTPPLTLSASRRR